MADRSIRLQPIAMIVPAVECIYAPSQLRPVKEVSEAEFRKFSPHVISVSFDPDGHSGPNLMVAYQRMGYWYLVMK